MRSRGALLEGETKGRPARYCSPRCRHAVEFRVRKCTRSSPRLTTPPCSSSAALMRSVWHAWASCGPNVWRWWRNCERCSRARYARTVANLPDPAGADDQQLACGWAAITGASYLLEVVRPLTHEDGGRLRLVCDKNRHGNYRRGKAAATVDIAVYSDTESACKHGHPSPPPTTPAYGYRTIAGAAVRATHDACRVHLVSDPSATIISQHQSAGVARFRIPANLLV